MGCFDEKFLSDLPPVGRGEGISGVFVVSRDFLTVCFNWDLSIIICQVQNSKLTKRANKSVYETPPAPWISVKKSDLHATRRTRLQYARLNAGYDRQRNKSSKQRRKRRHCRLEPEPLVGRLKHTETKTFWPGRNVLGQLGLLRVQKVDLLGGRISQAEMRYYNWLPYDTRHSAPTRN